MTKVILSPPLNELDLDTYDKLNEMMFHGQNYKSIIKKCINNAYEQWKKENKQVLMHLEQTLNDDDFAESVTYTKTEITIHADIALQCNIKDKNIRKILQDRLQTDITIRR